MEKIKEKILNNNKIKQFKKIWSVPRYRSLILLCFYFIFFLFLSVAIRSTPNENVENSESTVINHQIETVISNLKIFSNNNYQYKITVNNEEVLNGNVKNGTNSILYQGVEYVFIYNSLYKNQEYSLEKVDNLLDMIIPLEKITIDSILSKLDGKKPSYDIGHKMEFETIFYINIRDFLETESNDTVKIILIGKEEQVEKIQLSYLTDNYILELIK